MVPDPGALCDAARAHARGPPDAANHRVVESHHMLLDTIFIRTRKGTLALSGADTPLSGGFRQLLRLINGKRSGHEILGEMSQLDEEDYALWTAELMRQELVAPQDEVPVEEMAFGMTAEMPVGLVPGSDPATSAMINDIMAEVSFSIGEAAAPEVQKRLGTTGRMAAIEAVRSHGAMGKAGFFVYPDAAMGLPEKPRVCIAGHVPAQNRVLELLLARTGIKPVVASTREELRSILSGGQKPHVLMVDAEMPMLDAFRTLDAMRTDSALEGVRVVILSTRGERADLARAMMLGAAAYIVKPLRKDVLDAALPQILGRASDQASPPRP